jgi:tRNA A22 N-methylase
MDRSTLAMIASFGSFLSVSSFGRCCFTTTTSNRAGQFLRFHGGVTSFAASRTATSCRWLSGSRCLDGSKQNQLHLAEEAIASLAVTGRTWKRLGPVVSLATAASSTRTTSAVAPQWQGTVADIGCDHGLLTFGLAATCRFERVIGVDVSQLALENGGWALFEEYQIKDNNDGGNYSKIEFVLGNGLQPILDQHVETICIAGMGVGTMRLISEPSELERVRCQRIVVQPTHSRPRQLMQLYKHFVVNCGFSVEKEHISFLSNRWYISTLFQRRKQSAFTLEDGPVMPGCLLVQSDDEEQRRIYNHYVEHHIAWVRKDNMSKQDVDEQDQIWLDAVADRNYRESL